MGRKGRWWRGRGGGEEEGGGGEEMEESVGMEGKEGGVEEGEVGWKRRWGGRGRGGEDGEELMGWRTQVAKVLLAGGWVGRSRRDGWRGWGKGKRRWGLEKMDESGEDRGKSKEGWTSRKG